MKKVSLPSDFFKLVALITMTLDHFTSIFGVCDFLSNTVGRMAFPIFSFLVIKNLYEYHPVKKYLIRLGIFGVLTSAVLYVFNPELNNVLFTFFWAVLFISVLEYLSVHVPSLFWQGYVSGLLFLSLFPFIIRADYSIFGFFFLMALYTWFCFPTRLNYGAVLITGTAMNFIGILPVLFTLMTLVFLMSFCHISGGKRLVKWWVFYAYYPLHRLFLYAIKILFFG